MFYADELDEATGIGMKESTVGNRTKDHSRFTKITCQIFKKNTMAVSAIFAAP